MAHRRWSVHELAEAFHLAYAADFVVANDLVDDNDRSGSELAARVHADPVVVSRMLQLLALRTDLVVQGRHGFRRGPGLDRAGRAAINHYVGAYGPNAAALSKILASVDHGRGLANEDRYALAFHDVPGAGAALLPDLLRRLGLGTTLDLGCGTGQLLVEMAQGDPGFTGFGVDINPAMVRAAHERRDASNVAAHRVQFFVGDAGDPATAVPAEVLQGTKVVVAASLLNELFHPDTTPAVRCLQALRTALPGRALIVADYYGSLGHIGDPTPEQALHDWIQLISAQGVPPPDLPSWEAVYHQAGCALVYAFEDNKARAFVHVVRLAPADSEATGEHPPSQP
jgi:SAM-dependent methyltransferase